jgi:hypothetical protein
MPASKPASAGGLGSRIAAAAAGAGAAAAAAVKNATGKADPDTADGNQTVHDDAGSPAPAGPGDAVPATPAASQRPAAPAPTAATPIASGEGTAAEATQPPATQAVPSAPAATPRQAHAAEQSGAPKVSRWSDDDLAGAAATGAGGGTGAADAGAPYDRGASSFPASARDQPDAYEEDDYYEDEEPVREPRSMRWLVGGILAAVLVVGLILAVNTLGGLLGNNNPPAAKQSTAPTTAGNGGTGTAGTNTSAPPAAAAPVIEGVTRQGDFDFAGTYDKDLTKTFDGNAASFWSNMEFATDNWGGLAPDGVPLIVKLKEPAEVKSITLSQLGASGGSISVYTNDRPAMDGAKLVGTNSFTSPELAMPLSTPTTAQYVIINIKTLPKLAAPKTQFGFGLRLAEIKIQ